MNKLKAEILKILQNHKESLTRAAIASQLSGKHSDQQVLRALRALEADGQVQFEGNTKARLYRLAGKRTARSTKPRTPPPSSAAELPFSGEAVEALAEVDRPPHLREPAHYRREFLDAYAPNETSYLPAQLRERLLGLGRTPDNQQPAGTYARHVLERFLFDLSWSSARLEGNTYSLLDTERLLKAGASAKGKTAVETQMLLNHKAAIEFIVAEPMTAGIDERTFKTLHALLMENLLGNRLDEGALRSTPVQIGGSTYLPLANPQLIDECFRQVVLTARQIGDPFECSFFLLVHLPYLQPFLDGNKRTARLASNLPFVVSNLVPLSFIDVPREVFLKAYLAIYENNHIEPLRDIFSWAYQRSVSRLGQVRATLGEPDPFRLEHRAALHRAVADAVRAKVKPDQRRAFLKRFAEAHLPAAVRARFIATAELELEGLNDATFARYGLRPSEYETWKALS